MGAYNKEGQLTRVVMAAKEKRRNQGRDAVESTQQNQGEGPESADKSGSGDGMKVAEIPPENTRDLAPFPMNRAFTFCVNDSLPEIGFSGSSGIQQCVKRLIH